MTPVRAVLDTTAICAYAAGNVNVGEPLGEIADEGCVFAVPDLCLVEAAARISPDLWPVLDVLLAHDCCVRTPLGTSWRELARVACRLDGVGRAVAVAVSVEHRACLLTAEPDVYGDNPLVIGV